VTQGVLSFIQLGESLLDQKIRGEGAVGELSSQPHVQYGVSDILLIFPRVCLCCFEHAAELAILDRLRLLPQTRRLQAIPRLFVSRGG